MSSGISVKYVRQVDLLIAVEQFLLIRKFGLSGNACDLHS